MKLTVAQKDFARALDIVERACPAKSPLPILQATRIRVTDGTMELAGNNLEMAIKTSIDATVTEEGSAAIPVKLLSDFVTSLGHGDVTIESMETQSQFGGGGLHLTSGRYEANVNGYPPEDWVDPPELKECLTASVPPALLRTLIHNVAMAAATDETRPNLSGVSFVIDESRISLAAADGFRLAVRHMSLPTPVEQRIVMLVPARAMLDLEKMLNDQEPVRVSYSATESKVLFEQGRLRMFSRLIEGQFPDYERILPEAEKITTRVVVGLGDFRQAVKAASVFCRDNSNILRLHAKEGLLEVRATSAENGDDEGQVSARVEGAEVEVAFNCKFVMDAIGAIDEGRTVSEISIDLTSKEAVGLLHPTETQDHLHCIMPMHVSR